MCVWRGVCDVCVVCVCVMCVALIIKHAVPMCHCLRPDPLYNIFALHDFRKKNYRTQNVCFDFLYKFHLKHFSFSEELSEI